MRRSMICQKKTYFGGLRVSQMKHYILPWTRTYHLLNFFRRLDSFGTYCFLISCRWDRIRLIDSFLGAYRFEFICRAHAVTDTHKRSLGSIKWCRLSLENPQAGPPHLIDVEHSSS